MKVNLLTRERPYRKDSYGKSQMKRIIFPALIMLGLMTAPGEAAEVEFRRAMHLNWHSQIKTEGGENAIEFGEFMKIDWEQLARSYFKAYPLANLTNAQIKKLAVKSFFGDTSVDFLAPVPEAYKKARFLFLSEDGSRTLDVKALKGTVRYEFNRQMTRILRVVFYGSVIGVPWPNNVTSGGFVASLADGHELSGEKIVSRKVPQLDVVNPYENLKIKQQIRYRFKGAEASFLFLQYEPDTSCDYGCCEFAYFLFRQDPETRALTQLGSSQYECDV